MSRARPLAVPLGEALREPLRAALAGRTVVRAPSNSGTASAVLIPLVVRSDEAHVWLVRRASTLRRHSGQVAFPGGKTDPADKDGLATALREAHEEIGLLPAEVDVLGQLDELVTGTGFTIAPFVSWVPAAFAPVASAAEVARVFAVPLATFFEKPRGFPPFHGYHVDGERVWGATGKILRDLVGIVRALPTS